MSPNYFNIDKKSIRKEGSWTKYLYSITLIAGTIGPLTNIPQIMKIYLGKEAAGVSLLTWILFIIFDIPFILWGIMQRDLPVTLTYSLWTVTNLVVVVGIVIYG